MLYSFAGKSPVIDETAFVSEQAVIIGDVEIGARCYIGPGAIIRGDAAKIRIEEEVAIEEGVIIHAGSGGCTESVIGRRVTIGHGAIVHSRSIAPSASIGLGAIISLNAEIGEYAVIAEGAVVKQKQMIPARIIAGGMPAKELRALEERDIRVWEGTKDWYVKLAAAYRDPKNYLAVP